MAHSSFVCQLCTNNQLYIKKKSPDTPYSGTLYKKAVDDEKYLSFNQVIMYALFIYDNML